MVRRYTWVVLAAAVMGCHADDSEAPPAPTPSACADPLEIALPDGSCIRPGIASDGCSPGFVHDGAFGCEAVLPPEPCPPGQMAVPGETVCRPVMPCGTGRWGDIPVDANTQYVDGAYAGGGSDGSEAQPWTTISEAVAAAAAAAVVAVARGSYLENVVIANKPVRLWGVCPDEVAIAATSQPVAPCPASALCIVNSAHGTEVHGVALGGAGIGLALSGVENVLVDRVRVHDADWRGIDAERQFGPTSLTVRGSLVDHNHDVGLLAAGVDVLLEGSVVAATSPRSAQEGGHGISVTPPCSLTPMGAVCDPTARANATVTGSLVEQNQGAGLLVSGSDVSLHGSVVRGTLPGPSGNKGWGISIQVLCYQTLAGPVCDSTARANATVTGSVVEQNHEAGLVVSGSDAIIESSVVRLTLPRPSDQGAGRGIHAQIPCIGAVGAAGCDAAAVTSAIVTGSLVDQNHESGLFIAGAGATLEASVVRATSAQASDGLFGDGLAVVGELAPAVVTVARSRIEDSARAGLANFGALIAIESTLVRCAAFELEGEPSAMQGYVFDDRGGNACGCPNTDAVCKAITTGIEPPEALPLGP